MANKSNTELQRDFVKRRKEAGLIQIKIWVAKNAPEEAKAIRKYAAGKPKTKLILKGLKP